MFYGPLCVDITLYCYVMLIMVSVLLLNTMMFVVLGL